MQTRRLFTTLTLIAFLPIAAGCSTTRSFDVGTDPSASAVVQVLLAGDSIEITGYTRASDGHRDFHGQIRLATQDTFELTPAFRAASPTIATDDQPLTIPCRDLKSVDIAVPDAGKTRLATAVTILAVGAAVTGAVVAASISSGNMDPWF